MRWKNVEEENVVENMFGVKKKGERVIVVSEIKRMLRGKNLTLSISCKKNLFR